MNSLTDTSSLTSKQKIFKNLLGAFLVVIGVSHFIVQKEFINQVPMWLPMDYELVVLISGAIEIILGVLLIAVPRKGVTLGWIIATYFVMIFPGNVSQYVNQKDAFGLNTDTLRLYRLFLQPILIAWTLWATNAWGNLIHKQAGWHNDSDSSKNKNSRNKSHKGSGHAQAS